MKTLGSEQLRALGVDTDYVDYKMGHVVDTYHDIQSKGVEFLRENYARAGLYIKPQAKIASSRTVKEDGTLHRP